MTNGLRAGSHIRHCGGKVFNRSSPTKIFPMLGSLFRKPALPVPMPGISTPDGHYLNPMILMTIRQNLLGYDYANEFFI
jgi:hypothetical protein